MQCLILFILYILSQNLPVVFFDCMDALSHRAAHNPIKKSVCDREKKTKNEGLQRGRGKFSLSNLFGRCGGGGRLMLSWRAAATELIDYLWQ